MPTGLSGNFADAVLIKRNDAEDGAEVGPALWTNTGGLFPVTSKFGSSYFSQPSSTNRLDSDSGISAFNNLDTAKYLYHFWWRTESLAPNVQTMVELGVAGHASYMSRIRFETGSKKLVLGHLRTDAAFIDVEASFATAFLPLDTFNSIVAFVDVTNSTGKIFINGIDRTTGVLAPSPGSVVNTTTPFVRIGNHINLLDPARFVDHVTVVQNTTFTVAQIEIMAPLYHDTRGFGFNPQFLALNFRNVSSGDTVTLTGTGFGADVNITVASVDALNIVRTDDSKVTFEVPPGIGSGVVDLDIINVAAGVTWTQTGILNIENTIWIPNGGSDRIARFGDKIKYGEMRIGDPLPFGNPNIDITDWTTISRSPE